MIQAETDSSKDSKGIQKMSILLILVILMAMAYFGYYSYRSSKILFLKPEQLRWSWRPKISLWLEGNGWSHMQRNMKPGM